MSEDDAVAAQSLASRTNALVHGVIGQNEIIFQAANWDCRSQCHVSLSVSDRRLRRPMPRMQIALDRNGDVESLSSGSSRFTASCDAQPAGMLKPLQF